MKTLVVNAHPDFHNPNHFSIQLYHYFLEQFKNKFPKDTIEEINLYDMAIPQVTNGQLFSLWDKQAKNIPLTDSEKQAARLNQKLLEQFKSHHRIVIVEPLHNFNVTSRLKDYIDNVLVARETFRYTADGSVGLMTDDYRIMLLQGSGSIYTNNDRYTPLEFSRAYLDAIFTELMGFDTFQIVRAQGTQVADADPSLIMDSAKQDLQTAFKAFYDSH
ncbi:FMN-dependent NADH-azoreductase [Enterococcus xiangfangensis]|uniref:FMN dependent NADH:quinone oxidoreductase n=1 Tax=Enterococcus xiangfangensis TaxID=1296537 RepID=A0ABU3F987_9ENTE|nr:NAD(P)H-dependent oxidoreductase [Enterococcus xiangfangensis]MDT2759214.1 NAD(P)H-dependent oxidoreductase [Enterococcus xiangfangensis]